MGLRSWALGCLMGLRELFWQSDDEWRRSGQQFAIEWLDDNGDLDELARMAGWMSEVEITTDPFDEGIKDVLRERYMRSMGMP